MAIRCDKQELKIIENAIDKAILAFRANEEWIFNDEKEILIFKYKSLIPLMRDWKRGRTCIVHNCKNTSIERSHTIQKSGSIKLIAENGHVLSPQFNTNSKKIELMSIGINEASTFPGYCSEHEKLFDGFESIKDIETEEHLGLQLYRTVCREIITAENQIKTIKQFFEDYKVFRDKKITDLVKENLAIEISNLEKIEIKSLKFSYEDRYLQMAKSKIGDTQSYLNGFLYKFHDAILNDLSKKKFQKIVYKGVMLDRILPVALAGSGVFNIKLKTKSKIVHVLLNVLPLENKTYIFTATFNKNKSSLDAYMSQFINPLEIISMVENWMINGSDHWFIKPSVWNEIEESERSEIINVLTACKHNLGSELNMTIFREMKIELIKLMDDNYDQLNESLITLLNKEKLKLPLTRNRAAEEEVLNGISGIS